MHQTLMALKQRAASAEKAARQQAVQDNLTRGEAFLAENGKQKGVTILPGGLQ